MKKSIIFITCAIVLFFWVFIFCNKMSYNNVEEYVALGEYVLLLRDNENAKLYFNSEQAFLEQCDDENVRSIVEKKIRIQSIETIGRDMVVIINYTGLFTKRGYLIVGNNYVEIPNEKLESAYEWAEYRKIGENVYKFTWFPILL